MESETENDLDSGPTYYFDSVKLFDLKKIKYWHMFTNFYIL